MPLNPLDNLSVLEEKWNLEVFISQDRMTYFVNVSAVLEIACHG